MATSNLGNFSAAGAAINTGLTNATTILQNTFTGSVNNINSTSLPSFTNLAATLNNPINAGIKVETNMPKWPSWYAGSFATPGAQTGPGLSRGYITNTGISVTNNNLAHICDFRFIFSSGISLGGLVNPITAFAAAIKQGKAAAASAIRAAISQLSTAFRAALDALIGAAGSDPTGMFSVQFSLAKDVIRQVNDITKKIAQMIADVATVYYLVQGLTDIVNWIKSLPDQLKSVLQSCLTNFQKSVDATVASFKGATDLSALQNSVTAQMGISLTSSASQSTSANSSANGVSSSANTTSAVVSVLSSYSTATANSESSSVAVSQVINSNTEILSLDSQIASVIAEHTDSIDTINANSTEKQAANTSGP